MHNIMHNITHNNIYNIPSTLFQCNRCHAQFTTKYGLACHLQRKKACIVTFDNMDTTACLQELKKERPPDIYNHKCVHCTKGFKNAKNKYRHHKICMKNPKSIQVENVVNENLTELESQILKLKEDLIKKNKVINELQQYKKSSSNITQNIKHITTQNIYYR